MTVAGDHFAKVEEQKKAELKQLKENPRQSFRRQLSAAGAHFAKVEEQKKAEKHDKLKENPRQMSVAGAHFAKK